MAAETNEDVVASNEATIAAMSHQHALQETGNRNYSSEEKRYKRWIEQNDPGRVKFNLPPSKFISVDTLATYYLHEQAKRTVQRRTVMKSVYALNKLAEKEQAADVLGERGGKRSIEYGPFGQAIVTALKTISNRYATKRKERDEVCPQQDLPTNIISQRDQSIVLTRVLSRHDQSWADTAATWSVAANTLIRFESVKRVRLNRLKILNDLPPGGIITPHDTEGWEDTDNTRPDGKILGIVLPPSDQLKKNKTTDDLKAEVVGGYQHKRYERCYHGIIGFVLLERLNDGQVISFMSKNFVPAGETHWTEVPIFHYKYDAANKAFKRARELAQVDKWLKSTHMR